MKTQILIMFAFSQKRNKNKSTDPTKSNLQIDKWIFVCVTQTICLISYNIYLAFSFENFTDGHFRSRQIKFHEIRNCLSALQKLIVL
jgi:hypothetical protein